MDIQQVQNSYKIITNIASDLKEIATVSFVEDIPETLASNSIIDSTLFYDTRGYFKKLVYQINVSYKNSCYDATALLIRKLIELLIEDIYESQGRVNDILNPKINQLVGLGQLISILMADSYWKLNRHVEDGLNLIKNQGDKSAHNRRYNAKKQDIDKIQPYLRDIFEELLYLAKIKK